VTKTWFKTPKNTSLFFQMTFDLIKLSFFPLALPLGQAHRQRDCRLATYPPNAWPGHSGDNRLLSTISAWKRGALDRFLDTTQLPARTVNLAVTVKSFMISERIYPFFWNQFIKTLKNDLSYCAVLSLTGCERGFRKAVLYIANGASWWYFLMWKLVCGKLYHQLTGRCSQV